MSEKTFAERVAAVHRAVAEMVLDIDPRPVLCEAIVIPIEAVTPDGWIREQAQKFDDLAKHCEALGRRLPRKVTASGALRIPECIEMVISLPG